ncbi:MAG: hypothetical protein GYA58_08105 [Anaerolineaceae bacterium]|nr:hypothetical protein [Anaerolineaceae bacterium]
MFRRPLRRAIVRPAMRNVFNDELTQAEELLAAGKPAEAAALFTRMAQQANLAGRPRQAANLHARAAHAWLDAGDQSKALLHARQALDLFTHLGMTQRAIQFKSNFSRHLRQCNAAPAAEQFEHETDLPLAPAASDSPAKHGQLPPTCPQCGAPLRSDMVEWIDDHNAECEFCGATIPCEA